jgi:hypothetical protein
VAAGTEMGWAHPKFHSMRHLVRNIVAFGCLEVRFGMFSHVCAPAQNHNLIIAGYIL